MPKLKPKSASAPYSNFLFLDPNGEELFRCDQKKANWYLSRGLAVAAGDGKARLLFAPGGEGEKGDDYMLGVKDNRCVVCGGTEGLSKHHVVPLCFRRHFPRGYKAHNSYDVLVMCIKCHKKYERDATRLKRRLAFEATGSEKLGAENIPGDGARELGMAISAANALANKRDMIPPAKIAILEGRLREFFGREFDADDLAVLGERHGRYRESKQTGPSVCEKVVAANPDLDAFAMRWRDHFLKVMKPRFMPDGWDAKRPAYFLRS